MAGFSHRFGVFFLIMGGAESASELRLDVSEPNVELGQYLNGYVHLSLSSDIQAQTLILKLKGKEYVQWTERPGGSSRANNTQPASTTTYTGTNLIALHRFPIHHFHGGHVKAGTYIFPFTVQIQSHLPGTFSKVETDVKAFITYTLTALIDHQKAVKRSKTDVNLIHPWPKSVTPVQDEVAARVRSWVFVSKGEVRLTVSFNKKAFKPREIAEILVAIDNTRCTSAIVRVTAELHRRLRIQDNTGRAIERSAVLSTSGVDVDIAPGQPRPSAIRIHLPITSNSNELDFAPTVIGTRLQCTHLIQVRAVMSAWLGCCGQDPKVLRFVKIYPVRRVGGARL